MRVINVEVLCPSTSRRYDYRISPDMIIGEVKKHIIEDIRTFEGLPDLFENEEDVKLFLPDNTAADEKCEIGAAGVKSGDSIMII